MFLGFLGFSTSNKCGNRFVTMCQNVWWHYHDYGRGHNFCLQKSRMPMGRIGIFSFVFQLCTFSSRQKTSEFNCMEKVMWTGQTKNCLLSVHVCFVGKLTLINTRIKLFIHIFNQVVIIIQSCLLPLAMLSLLILIFITSVTLCQTSCPLRTVGVH